MKVSHPHIVDTKEIIHDEQNYYIASEICEGGQLFEMLMKINSFSEKDAASIIK